MQDGKGRLTGKVALVTGAASGIGRAAAEGLAREGAGVILTDVQSGEEVAAGIRNAGGQAVFQHHDVADEGHWQDVIADVSRSYGRLDVLVNNAGIVVPGPVTDLSLEAWRRQMAVNVDGVFLGVKTSLPLMRRTGGGSIINISSIAGLRGAPNLSAYCASKGAVRLFTKAVALECATARDGIRCNSIHPGIIDTPIWGQVAPGLNSPVDLDALSEMRVPLRRKGIPADISSAVVFLASDDSSYMTGEEMVIDGGMTIGSI
jgi:NAD(P)-dependent dehydrogenase (short-subunit alcohol dehydrogenase family)